MAAELTATICVIFCLKFAEIRYFCFTKLAETRHFTILKLAEIRLLDIYYLIYN